jgi:hypothetical protein
MALAMYVCENMPNLKLRVIDGDNKAGIPDQYVKFENKVLQLDEEADAERIKALDHLMVTRDNIRMLIRKASMERAVALVKEHQQKMNSLSGQIKGPVTAAHNNLLKMAQQSDHLRVQMQADGATPEQIEKAIEELAADSQLIIAVKADGPLVAPTEGVTMTPDADQKRHVETVAGTRTEGPRPKMPTAPIAKPPLKLK